MGGTELQLPAPATSPSLTLPCLLCTLLAPGAASPGPCLASSQRPWELECQAVPGVCVRRPAGAPPLSGGQEFLPLAPHKSPGGRQWAGGGGEARGRHQVGPSVSTSSSHLLLLLTHAQGHRTPWGGSSEQSAYCVLCGLGRGRGATALTAGGHTWVQSGGRGAGWE